MIPGPKTTPKPGLYRDEQGWLHTPRRVLLRLLGSNELLTTFVLLSFVVLSAVWSVDRASWVPALHSLSLVAVVAMLTGSLAARSRWPGVSLHLLAAVLGSGIILWEASLLLPAAGWGARLLGVLTDLREWGYAITTRGVSSGVIAFSLALLGLTWLLSYLSAWLVFRGHRAWWAIIPSALMILVNLSNLPSRFYVHLFPFFLNPWRGQVIYPTLSI